VTIWWFGEPWPSDEFRAGVCEEDELRVDPPAGERCVACSELFTDHDRGVATPCSGRVWGAFNLASHRGGGRVCGYHLSCWLRLVVGGELPHEVLSRFPSEQERFDLQHEGSESAGEVGGWRDEEWPDEPSGEGAPESAR
jgi:hypothetical protein